MKMKIYGFSWVPEHLPESVPPTAVFERIKETEGKRFGDYIGAATLIGEWWAGVLLKVRDSKAFTTLRRQNGILVFKAEKLADGSNIAEPNFFIAHTTNGLGLYCHHHLSASLIGDFAYFCHHRFREIRDARRKLATSDPDMTEVERKKIMRQYKGRLVLEQILKPGTFDDHVKLLKNVSKFEANLVAFELKQPMFRPITQNARRTKVLLTFDHDANHGLITNSIASSHEAGIFDKATVTGEDAAGMEQTYRTAHDSAVFGEHDYDDMITALTVRFDDLAGSIEKSKITTALIQHGNDKKVRAALGLK